MSTEPALCRIAATVLIGAVAGIPLWILWAGDALRCPTTKQRAPVSGIALPPATPATAAGPVPQKLDAARKPITITTTAHPELPSDAAKFEYKPQKLTFTAGGKEVLSLGGNGDVWVQGRKLKGVQDERAWAAMQEFMRAHTNYGSK